MIRRVLLVALVFVACASPGTPDESAPLPPAPESTPSEACWDTAGTTLEIGTCLAERLNDLEDLLRLVEDRVAYRVPDAALDDLTRGMGEWKRLRDRDCRVVGSFFEGGSIRPLQEAACRLDRTGQRLRFLAPLLCDGAGMAGPCEDEISVRRQVGGGGSVSGSGSLP